MKRYISALLLSASLVGFTGCDDFLDEMPESSIIPENFFSTADQLAAYSIALYGNFPVHDQYTYSLGTFIIDNGTDNQVGMSASSQWSPGLWQTPSGSGWSFTFIRNCNYFLQNVLPKYEAGQISGNATEVKQYIGEMYFLRAYAYWNQYSAYGDFPIITEALPDDKEVLMAQTLRRPRNEVARFILDDLAKAIDLLPVNATGGKQRINKACAQLLRSRVALFEGTWLKYHKGTALVPGGPGWPGDPSMISGFNIDQEITYFLSEAMASAQRASDITVGAPKKSTINSNIPSPRQVIQFADRYMKASAQFTGYDASEGALYVLFMLALAMHPQAPSIFAVDSFDHALNPRLAKKMIQVFCEQVIQHKKHVFLTTHNPLVLDGLDLRNDDIRLFALDRDSHGYAQIKRILVSQELINEGQPLSRLWINGRLGGVPTPL